MCLSVMDMMVVMVAAVPGIEQAVLVGEPTN